MPNSAGAYCVGVERAPGALRAAGLVEQLRASGTDVVDAGDLTTRLWFPDRERPFAQNLGEEADALVELSTAAASLLAAEQCLLVLGGSCTVAVGLCDAMARAGERPRLVYIDRHLDLNTPLDDGGLTELDGDGTRAGSRGGRAGVGRSDVPHTVVQPSELVYLGVDLSRETTDWERGQAAEHRIAVVDQTALCDDPRGAAADARRILASGPFLVHLDVDVLDFLDAPIAENVNGRNSGPTIAILGQALGALLQDPDCWGLSIGQLDPAHASADRTAIPRLVSVLVSALSST
ncbi:arginase family protein [Gordonia hongkongensis]|nr:arginase family protein [Gordonia hongkongensis]UPG68623.1 arginase family protein [Gordonia hongkongensis]